jgi:hypothetical protein
MACTSGHWNGQEFLAKTPKAQETKAKLDDWDCIKLKASVTAKETISRMQTAYRMGEHVCKIYI